MERRCQTIYARSCRKCGTVDITVHKRTQDRSLKEIHNATGGDWGGIKVDQEFEKLITEITGPGVMEKFKENNMENYLDLMKVFEVKKRGMKFGKLIAFKIPLALIELAVEITGEKSQNTISNSKYKNNIKLVGDKLRLEYDIMVEMFKESIKNIIDHLSKLFENPDLENCDTILMVGGYSESPLLQKKIKDHFPNKRVIVPADAGTAVLKGAVMYGHNPTLIAQRIYKYTYGIRTTHNKSESCNHPDTDVIQENGKLYCDLIFHTHVRIGDVVTLGEELEEHIFNPRDPYVTSISITIYYTKERNPILVTEKGCNKLGEVIIPLPNTTGGCERKIGVSFLFGGTEIEVKVRDKQEGTEKKT